MIARIKEALKAIQENPEISTLSFRQGKSLYLNGQCQMLTQAGATFEFLIDDEFDDFVVTLHTNDDEFVAYDAKGKEALTHHLVATLMQLAEEMERLEKEPQPIGKAYTREGMIRRVMKERTARALKAEYKVDFADNPYGEHILINEKAHKYKITFRDMEKETGYCSCMDYRTNKLGTCKHLMFAFNKKKEGKKYLRKPRTAYPFVEICLDPLNDNRISWFFPDELEAETEALIKKYFGDSHILPQDKMLAFLDFLAQADEDKHILVRPEVYEMVEKAYDADMLESISRTHELDFSPIKAKLFPYQEKGVQFATFKKGVIIADEMGLGKTLQAISTAIMKKQLFGFSKTLVVCPASVKHQWAKEIEKFSDEKVEVVEGTPKHRHLRYRESDAFFLIINYETVLRDRKAINKADMDFIILDEAQRIKNYDTITARSIKGLEKKHAADTVINFELPWNPAKKNQRIGRIDRLGQTADHLTVINLFTMGTIEMKIAAGLEVKQNLFESVLDQKSTQDTVDFSERGRAQFLKQLQDIIDEFDQPGPAEGVSVDPDALEEIKELITEGESEPPIPSSTSDSTEDAIPTPQTLGTSPKKQETEKEQPQTETTPAAQRAAEIQEVMTQGMGFLGSLFKMATGKDMGMDAKSIEVDPKTGEVVMRFKMPV